MNNFHEMGLPLSLTQSLDRMNFSTPTPIQAQAIPVAMLDKDILGSAQTGTGKTLAFVIPLLAKLMSVPTGSALVLVPTRELAQQVMSTIANLMPRNSALKTTLLIGGEPYFIQLKQLRVNPRIIVGTPGRIIDHLERGTLSCADTSFLVLDEADRMFDMGFGIQLEQIMKRLPKKRQTLMFSATVPKHIEKLVNQQLHEPERISVGSSTTPYAKIKQEMVKVTESEKFGNLLVQLKEREGSILIFVKTKFGADRLADRLSTDGHPALAIHGDLRQQKRERVIKDFRRGDRYRILVATDIAARGLDIPQIRHVINFDLPQSPEDYIHRIGRTARAGAEGSALCMVTPQERRKWLAIHQLIDPSAASAASQDRPTQSKRGKPRSYNNNSGGKKTGAPPRKFNKANDKPQRVREKDRRS